MTTEPQYQCARCKRWIDGEPYEYDLFGAPYCQACAEAVLHDDEPEDVWA